MSTLNMATKTSDPVLNILTELKKGTSRHYDSRTIEDAIKTYNEMVKENSELKKDVVKANPQPVAGKTIQEKLDDLRAKNTKLVTEVNQLKTRLSQVLGNKLTEGNAQVSDLSDPNRPISLADKFSQVYDAEWVDAYEELEKQKIIEVDIIKILADIVKGADAFCEKALLQMTDRIEKLALDDITCVKLEMTDGKYGKDTVVSKRKAEASESDESTSRRLVKGYIKALGHLSVQSLMELYDYHHLKPILEKQKIHQNLHGINHYAKAVVSHTWNMHLADPPMVFAWQEKGQSVSREISRFYTKTGRTVVQAVWPAILLSKEGQVISYGIVMAE